MKDLIKSVAVIAGGAAIVVSAVAAGALAMELTKENLNIFTVSQINIEIKL